MTRRFLSGLLLLVLWYGCAGEPVVDMPRQLPENVRAYKHLTLYGQSRHWIDTGIFLSKGDFFTILADGRIRLSDGMLISPADMQFQMRIGVEDFFSVFGYGRRVRFLTATVTGQLYLGVRDRWRQSGSGSFDVDIIVWKKEDFVPVAAFFEKMNQAHPENKAVKDAFTESDRYRRYELARRETTEAIQLAKSEIDRLKQSAGNAYSEDITRLEAKVAALMDKLRQLDDLEAELKAEQNRADQLARKLVRVSKEKEALAAKLQNEADVKQRLESTLKERETAFQSQEALVATLYEQERQLKSKLLQLDQAADQSREKQVELSQLEARADDLNRRLHAADPGAQTEVLRNELDRIHQEKSALEREAQQLQLRQGQLKEEVDRLHGQAETARLEKERSERELAALRGRETQLLDEVSDLRRRLKRGMAPVVVVAHPEKDTVVTAPATRLQFTAVDDRGIEGVTVLLNDNPISVSSDRGLKVAAVDPDKRPKRISVSEKIPLQIGENRILIQVADTDGATRDEAIVITREEERGVIWAVVVGINRYQHARPLKYAVNDAAAFRDYLQHTIGVPQDRLFYIVDEDATRERVQSLLGTLLKRKAGPEDTVIIFYAGHGAVETDPTNPDGDGFEKYLLPQDADLADLYTSAISMNEVRTIFQRIQAQRLIFIADTCYSGASGGRTTLVTKTRANLSEKFVERIAKGRGRVIITSCSANEVSKEDDNLGHGIFSYYLMEGLKGDADRDEDGIITVDELFSYISRKVPEASNQDQHPVKKGEVEGELVIGYVK